MRGVALVFKELSGTCFGYTHIGTDGNAIGKVLRTKALDTIKDLINEGETDPALFELLGVFQENIGCDRISDLITFILTEEIYTYSDRIAHFLKLPTKPYIHNRITYNISFNKYNQKPLLLLPSDILSPLPIMTSFDDIDFITAENQRVRDEINAYFDLNRKKKIRKSDILLYMHQSPSFRKALISAYKSFPKEAYDFEADPIGEYSWLQAAKEYTQKYPLDLIDKEVGEIKDVLFITTIICKKFKELIEDNGLHDLLYDSTKKPKHERAAQLLFFGVADSYCIANNIDLCREINGGRGPVDFKLSRGANEKVIVEVKLTSNSQLKHGIEKQLPIYMKQEKTCKAIYLIIDNGHPQALETFITYCRQVGIAQKEKIEVITIDGTYKPSASNA